MVSTVISVGLLGACSEIATGPAEAKQDKSSGVVFTDGLEKGINVDARTGCAYLYSGDKMAPLYDDQGLQVGCKHLDSLSVKEYRELEYEKPDTNR